MIPAQILIAETLRPAGFVLNQFDEDFLSFWRGDEEEVYPCSSGSLPRHRINRRLAESQVKNFRCAIHVVDSQLDLLNSLASSSKKSSNCAHPFGFPRRQNVQSNSAPEVKLEFPGVLVGRDVGETRRSVGGPHSIKIGRMDGNAHRRREASVIRKREQLLHFGVCQPDLNRWFGRCAPAIE